MSNDAKLWAWRVIVFIMFSIDGTILAKAITPTSAQSAVSAKWFVIFFIVCILNIPVYVLYIRAKNNRWKSNDHKTQEQIQVETLAAAAKFAQAEKNKPIPGKAAPKLPEEAPKNPPQ